MATRDQIGQMLVEAQLIDEVQLRSVKARHDQWGGRFPHVVVEMGLASEAQVVRALARALKVPVVNLEEVPKDISALARLDAAFAQAEGVFPIELKENGKVLLLAMTDPTDLELVDNAGRKARARISPLLAGELDIQNAIRRHYLNQPPLPPPRQAAPLQHFSTDRMLSASDLGGSEEDAPVVLGVPTRTDPYGAAHAARSPGPKPALSRALTDSQAMLNDILAEMPASVFTPEEEARIRTLADNQHKSGLILRALHQLLKEKGYLA